MKIGKLLGQNLQKLIGKSGYSSVEKFAYENGIDKSALSKILRGERLPRIDTAIRIAEALEVTLNDLYPMPPKRKEEPTKGRRRS